MIADQDISVVVQGPVLLKAKYGITDETTKLVCLRIKELFPMSQLILSTWEGERTAGIPFDKLILSEDPGATWFNYENYELLNNCNRLIVSTKRGLAAASRKYVLKIRSDLFVMDKKFLNFFYQFPHSNPDFTFVKNRIIAFSLYTIKGHRTSLFTMRRPFHISDWAYFGYKEDLVDLYDIPLTNEPEFSQWFLTRCKPFFDIEPHRLWKMPPEQYVTSSFFKKKIDFEFHHTADASEPNLLLSDQLLTNNFLVLDQNQFNLVSLKYLNFQLLFDPLLSRTALFYSTWLKDYCQHCHVTSSFTKFRYQLIALYRTLTYRILNFLFRPFQEKFSWLVGRKLQKHSDRLLFKAH